MWQAYLAGALGVGVGFFLGVIATGAMVKTARNLITTANGRFDEALDKWEKVQGLIDRHGGILEDNRRVLAETKRLAERLSAREG